MTTTTECGKCRHVGPCHDDGEAYVCDNEGECVLRCEIDLLKNDLRQVMQSRDALLSAEHASVPVTDLNTYKVGYETKSALIHDLVAALTHAQAVITRAVNESGHTRFCRAYQDIGDCDCWYGEAWAAVDTKGAV